MEQMTSFRTHCAVFGLCVLGQFCGSQAAVPLMGPGVPKVTFAANELFKPLSLLKALGTDQARAGNNLVAMHNGYLFILFAPDAPDCCGGLSFWDISDPRKPKMVSFKDDNDTKMLREVHGIGWSSSYDRDYAVLQATKGIQFWDFTDINKPTLIKTFVLPGVEMSDYDVAAWHLHFQAPYVFVSGNNLGLFVVDAHDPANPILVKNVPTSKLGGFSIGQVYPIGNLLVLANKGLGDEKGYSTVDISDPRNPILIATLKDGPPNYSTHVNGGRIYGDALDDKLWVHDISDPTQFKLVGSSAKVPNANGEYVFIQDHYAHVGMEEVYLKMDLEDNFAVKGTATLPTEGQEGFATPLGNLVVIGDDHGYGAGIFAHQAEPDNKGPEVNMMNPKPMAVKQALTSRVGMTFTDFIDLKSVNESTLVVRPVGGGAPLKGKYSHGIEIVNFSPDDPLKPNTTYEVFIPKGGIRDYSGNPVEKDYTWRFATGTTVDMTTRIRPRAAFQATRSPGFGFHPAGTESGPLRSVEGKNKRGKVSSGIYIAEPR